MNTLRLALSTFTIQLLWLAAGCCDQEINVPFSWQKIEVSNLDNSGRIAQPPYNASVPATAYGIEIMFGFKSVFRFTPVPAAYATSCPDVTRFINTDSVLAIRIHAIPDDSSQTVRDVTADFEAVRSPSPYAADEFLEDLVTIPDLIRGMNDDDQVWSERVRLLRTQGLDRSPGIRFSVTIELEGGRNLSDTTQPITLI